MANHTRGPWEADADRVVAPCGKNGSVMVVANMANMPMNGEANMRLIAAAPDLLAALKRVHGALIGVLAAVEEETGQRGPAMVYEVLNEGRAAITKATGAQNG